MTTSRIRRIVALVAVFLLAASIAATTTTAQTANPTKAAASVQSASALALPTVTNDSFAAAARVAGYTDLQIAVAQKSHKEDMIPVFFSNTKIMLPAVSPSTSSLTKQTTVTPNIFIHHSFSCHNLSYTAYGKNYLGVKLYAFTVPLYYCIEYYNTVYCPCISYLSRIYNFWSPDQVTSNISQHTFLAANVGGWEWVGLDSVGNYGPGRSGSSLIAQRTGHWHYSMSYGIFTVHYNGYPWVKYTISSNGSAAVSTGDHG